MKLIYSNIKKGEVKIKVETLDDLWYLSQIIDVSDILKGKTERKIKIGKETDRSQRVFKKTIFISLKVEKTEFNKYSSVLRASGVIVEGPEEVQKGSHHTFNLEENTIFTLIKKEWLKFQIDRLKEAQIKTTNLLICVLDRENAIFAKLKKYGYKILSQIKGDVQKKRDETQKKSNFYVEVINSVEEYDKRYNFDNIIVASPAFWKEDLMKNLKNDVLKKKIILATCSSVTESAINEILKRDELKKILKKERMVKETKLVENLLLEISKNNLAVYGFNETENASLAGAAEHLLVTDSFIREARDNNYEKLEAIMKNTEKSKGKITIISSEHDAGKKLKGLGGIGAILRYKINY